MDGIFRKKFLIFLSELRRQSLVMSDNKRRLAELGYNICGRKSFSGAGNAEKRLVPITGDKTFV